MIRHKSKQDKLKEVQFLTMFLADKKVMLKTSCHKIQEFQLIRLALFWRCWRL